MRTRGNREPLPVLLFRARDSIDSRARHLTLVVRLQRLGYNESGRRIKNGGKSGRATLLSAPHPLAGQGGTVVLRRRLAVTHGPFDGDYS